MDSTVLNKRKNEILDIQEGMLKRATEAKVQLTETEEAQFKNLTAELDQINGNITRFAAIAKGRSEVGTPRQSAIITSKEASKKFYAMGGYRAATELQPEYGDAFWKALKSGKHGFEAFAFQNAALSASTTYTFTPYVNVNTGEVFILFTGTSAPSLAQMAQVANGDGNAPCAGSVYITAATGASGGGGTGGHGGGGSPSCFSPNTKVKTQRGSVAITAVLVGQDMSPNAAGEWGIIEGVTTADWDGPMLDMGDGELSTYLSDDANSKKHLGILFASDAAEVVISEFEPLQNGSFKIVLIRGTADQWKARPEDALSESEIEQKVERACLYAWLVAYFESDPASATISVKPGRPAKAKNGKEVKRALAEIRTIVIDGVEKIFTTDGINFRVHARGWHVRRHNVREHERHYASGKVAIVRAFQRGDINLGFVSHESQAAQPETRFSVQPDKVFFDTEQKAKSTAAGK
jgi:hypothetical protein